MKGTVSHELPVAAPGGEVWAIYGTLELARLAGDLVPDLKIEVVEGDGGVGTVLKVTLPPAGGTSLVYKEKLITIDNEKRIKEAETVEGGYLDLGFSLYITRFEIIEAGMDSSVIKSSIDYDIKEGFEQNASLVTTDAVAAVAQVIANYITQQKTPASVN